MIYTIFIYVLLYTSCPTRNNKLTFDTPASSGMDAHYIEPNGNKYNQNIHKSGILQYPRLFIKWYVPESSREQLITFAYLSDVMLTISGYKMNIRAHAVICIFD